MLTTIQTNLKLLLCSLLLIFSALAVTAPMAAAQAGAVQCGADLNLDDSNGNCKDASADCNAASNRKSGESAEEQASRCGTAGSKLNDVIATVINVMTAAVGIVAVIMIIIGGFKYITASGDANKISSAKTTITYAIVGLIIAALAQVIARFVLGAVT